MEKVYWNFKPGNLNQNLTLDGVLTGQYGINHNLS